MACLSRSVIANTCCNNSFSLKTRQLLNRRYDGSKLRIRASSADSEDCNVEECAPDKEVGKISVEWLAGEKTKLVGTFPPRKKWSGYVEKDTAGQTNIYSVEPAVYVAESAISSGTAGSSSDGAENTAAIVAGLALIAIAASASILLQVSKNTPQIQTTIYSGPSLTYYINKLKPPEIIQVEAPPSQVEAPSSMEYQNAAPEVVLEQVPDLPLESGNTVPEISQVESTNEDTSTASAESSEALLP